MEVMKRDTPQPVVITRHAALLQYLEELGIVPAGTPVYSHATPELVEGKAVIGVLPLRLASLAVFITEVPLDVPAELRGTELSLEQIREYAGPVQTYKVMRV